MLDKIRKLIQEHKPIRTTLYGDSICEVGRSPTYFGGASCAAQNWGQQLGRLLQKHYPTSPFTVTHFAIGGQNSFEGLGRLDGLAEHQPDLVLLSFGANDCGYHFLPPEATYQAQRELIGVTRGRFGADFVVIAMGGENPLFPTWRHPE
jgi:lysophospholipase L1-like esterase